MTTAQATREHPILFTGEMVRAILSDRKTQTRRVVKPAWQGLALANPHTMREALTKCPYGVAGDRLWVKETAYISPEHFTDYATDATHPNGRIIQYVASNADGEAPESFGIKKTPSIFMPRFASRLTLEVTDVRVQRLQDVDNDDAVAEGMLGDNYMARDHYIELWDSLNAKRGYSWDSNPWVWVIEFRRAAQAIEKGAAVA